MIKKFRDMLNEGRKVELKSRQNRLITFNVIDGKITNIVNNSGVNFPYKNNSPYNRGIETWCSNNNFLMDGKDMSPEKKIFGIQPKDIPKGDPLRMLFPNKFR